VETWQPKRQFFNTWWFYGSKENLMPLTKLIYRLYKQVFIIPLGHQIKK
jgi:hypothetical protein